MTGRKMEICLSFVVKCGEWVKRHADRFCCGLQVCMSRDKN